MKSIIILLMAVGLSACSALPQSSAIAPAFCSFATSTEAQAAALKLMDKLPPGTDKDHAMSALRMANLSADAACTLVKALEARQKVMPGQ